MQIVIDIDEEYYKIIKHDVERGMDYRPCVIIANGTPLPKEHGRLIDASQLPLDIFWEDIENTPTIIKADKGE